VNCPEDGRKGVGGVKCQGGQRDHCREGFGRADLDKAEEEDDEDYKTNGPSWHPELGMDLWACQCRAVSLRDMSVRERRSRERVVCKTIDRKVSTSAIGQSCTLRLGLPAIPSERPYEPAD